MKINEIVNVDLKESWLDTVKGWFKPKEPQEPQPGRVATGKVQNLPTSGIDITKLTRFLPGPAQILTNYAAAQGISNEELVQLVAQTSHETGDFKSLEEIGSKAYFKKYEPKFVRDKRTNKLIQVNPIAKRLGNTQPGDGERYKGRGHIQLTGRWNYRAAGQALGLPLEEQPDLVNRPEIGAKVTLWYWNTFVKPKVNDFNNVQAVTKTINPGLNGLQDRQNKFNRYMKAATQ